MEGESHEEIKKKPSKEGKRKSKNAPDKSMLSPVKPKSSDLRKCEGQGSKVDKGRKKRFASAPVQNNNDNSKYGAVKDGKNQNKRLKNKEKEQGDDEEYSPDGGGNRKKGRGRDKEERSGKNLKKGGRNEQSTKREKRDRERERRRDRDRDRGGDRDYQEKSTQRQETERQQERSVQQTQRDRTEREAASRKESSRINDRTHVENKKTNSDEIVDLVAVPAKPETPPIVFNQQQAEAAAASNDPKNPYKISLGAAIGTERCSYFVIRKLGSGGCGEAFIVQPAKSKKRYAVKTEFANVEEKRLRREFDIYRRINQYKKANRRRLTHLLQVIDFGECEGVASFLFLPLCDGSLESFSKDPKFPSLQTAFEISIQAMESIFEFHQIGYIHRDLKPANLVINVHDNRVYLIDFGMSAKSITEIDKMPNTSVYDFIGTVRYACRNAHRGVPQTRKDDMEAWLYVILELFNPNILSWSTAVSNDEVANKKDDFWSGKSTDKLDQIAPCFSIIYKLIKDMDRFDRPDYEQIFFELKREMFSRRLKTGRVFDFTSSPARVMRELDATVNLEPNPRVVKESVRKPFREPGTRTTDVERTRESVRERRSRDKAKSIRQNLPAEPAKKKKENSEEEDEEPAELGTPSRVKIDKDQK